MELSADQVAWHRVRGSGLVEPLGTPVEVARSLIGVQSQLVPPAGLAIGNRAAGAFTADDLDDFLHGEKSLLRTWGQRNTVHVYDTADWPEIVAATQILSRYQERFLKQFGGDADEMAAAVTRTGKILTGVERASRADVVAADPSLEEWFEFGNGLMMDLARQGEACHAGLLGSKSYFANRGVWLPDLAWDPPGTGAACVSLARRYFRSYGPASLHDLAFWFGCRVGEAKEWIRALGEEFVEVSVAGQSLHAVPGDLGAIQADPPPRRDWPPRLLHRFDPLLLAHKDKSWLVADEHYKAVWRKAGYVEAVALVGGRITGTWRYDRKGRGIEVRLRLFGPVPAAAKRALGREAESVAEYFDRPLKAFEVR